MGNLWSHRVDTLHGGQLAFGVLLDVAVAFNCLSIEYSLQIIECVAAPQPCRGLDQMVPILR